MPPPSPVHTSELLDRTAVWDIQDQDRLGRDFERSYAANTALAFRRSDAALAFCFLISPSASHVATVSAVNVQTTCTITATVYRIGDDGFNEKWSATHALAASVAAENDSFLSWERDHLHGGITEDGESVMLVFRPKHGSTSAFTVTEAGFVSRLPPSDTANRYALKVSHVSDDGEYIFYTRRGGSFGSGGQGEIVEIFSLRSLVRLKAMTFSFGDGYHHRNTRLLQPLRLLGPTYIEVEETTFGDNDQAVVPTPTVLLASSDGQCQCHVSGLDTGTGTGNPSNGSISPDGAHLVCVHKDAGLRHWDLKRPTLLPIGSTPLPGVLYGQERRWLIHGQETTMRDAVPDQIHAVRYSPACKLITIVTVGAGQVVINAFLTFNLQLVYHRAIPHATWNGLKALHIGFNESTGITIVAMSPTAVANRSGVDMVVGVLGVVLPLRHEFENIKKAEDYFDHGAIRAANFESINSADTIPECRFGWRPGALERNDPAAIIHSFGSVPFTSALDAQRQADFYESIFANPRSSVRMSSAPEARRLIVPHLFSFAYPWAPDQTVSIFGVVMRHQYHIIAIGPSPSAPGNSPDIIRALYANEIKTGLWEGSELIEIYKSGSNYILYVSQDQKSTAFSGAPMPKLRRTIASPHFVQEDAWYDTFIIHAASHVTMPTGWSSTPNVALMATSNIHAYFVPGSFVRTKVMDYGHRARAAYVAPKHLLWKEYGLRGFRKSRTADVFFGGGTYADSLGPYLRSIYDDRTYDDGAPLFSSSLALTCNAAYRSRETMRVDAFFRRLHQEDQLVMNNAQSISYTLPLACRARSTAALSFIRHLVLFPFKINDIGVVETRDGASTKSETEKMLDSWWTRTRGLFVGIYHGLLSHLSNPHDDISEPNTKHVTLPLQEFCSFKNSLHRAPPRSNADRDSAFWDFIRATTPYDGAEFLPWEHHILGQVIYSGRGPASPFTRLVEEILDMRDRDTQLSFLRVAWLEKLLAWKLNKFGLRVFLMRNVLPIVLLFVMNLAGAVLLTQSDGDEQRKVIRVVTVVLATIEGLLSGYIIFTKARQLFRVPRLFLSSIPNYIDAIALSLGIAMFCTVASGSRPSREFLAFSTLLMWVAAVLMLRIYRPVGMLLLLLTETIQEVVPFLALLIFIILGFAFVPYLLLRNHVPEPETPNVFSSFPLTIAQMINFIASDYDALQPWEEGSAAVRTLKALYIVVITILFLNTLIAILNLKIKRADKNAANLYHLQMASLQVQIELGLLSASERARRDWFPEWFSYSMTEREERAWNDFLEKNPVKWLDENRFGEEKDHASRPQLLNVDRETTPTRHDDAHNTAAAAPAAPPQTALTAATSRTDSTVSTPTTTGSTAATGGQPASGTGAPATPRSRTHQNSVAASASADSLEDNMPLIIHDKKPVNDDLLSQFKPFDVKDLPDPPTTNVEDEWQDVDDSDDEATGGSAGNVPVTAKTAQGHTPTAAGPANHPPATAAKATSAPRSSATAAAVTGESIELTTMTDHLSCVICGRPGSRCTSCMSVAYCCRAHQKQDWKSHKPACKGKQKAND